MKSKTNYSSKLKAETENISIVSTAYNLNGTKTYVVKGMTGKLYTVEVNEKPSCTCPDFANRGHVHRCKHIYFVLKKSLNVDDKNLDTYVMNPVVTVVPVPLATSISSANLVPLTSHLVFENVLTNTFKTMEIPNNDLIATIYNYIEKNYDVAAKEAAMKLYEEKVSNDIICKDKQFAGPYIIKINDNLFELHLKTIIQVNNGWIFNNIINKRKSEKIGRFILVDTQ